MKKYFLILFACVLVAPRFLYAGNDEQKLSLAVASNFRIAAIEIAAIFTDQTGNEINISSASSGKLYAQIINGAPFDIFFAADETTPIQLERKKLIVAGSRFTYAYGRLVLWGLDLNTSNDSGQYFNDFEKFNKIAIANPKLAPYGAAAVDALKNLALYDGVVNKLVYGENINQTFQYVVSKSAEIGFVSLSQVKIFYDDSFNEYWVIPDELHKPIRQQAVLLLRAKDSKIAYEFLRFMKSGLVKKMLKEKYGYYL